MGAPAPAWAPLPTPLPQYPTPTTPSPAPMHTPIPTHSIYPITHPRAHSLTPTPTTTPHRSLLYHYADTPGERSIELSWADLRRIATQHIGFEIIVSKNTVYS